MKTLKQNQKKKYHSTVLLFKSEKADSDSRVKQRHYISNLTITTTIIINWYTFGEPWVWQLAIITRSISTIFEHRSSDDREG